MRQSFLLVLVLVLMGLYMSVFIVPEGQRGIKLRFSKVVRSDDGKAKIYFPGLSFKIPLIESVKKLDARLQTMDNKADRFLTKEKKDLIIDSYVKWRITDFSRYYLATGGGSKHQAEMLLRLKFSNHLRSYIGNLEVKEIVTDSRGILTTKLRDALNMGTADNESDAALATRNITELIDPKYKSENIPVTFNQNSLASLGIEVVDVRIKQINLPVEISEAIFNRMQAERYSVSRQLRSKGKEAAAKMQAAADYNVTVTIADAEMQARIIRGQGDAEAAQIFAAAFKKNPEFYSFIRSLRAYEKSFNANNGDVMVLSADSDFFRYMQSSHKLKK